MQYKLSSSSVTCEFEMFHTCDCLPVTSQTAWSRSIFLWSKRVSMEQAYFYGAGLYFYGAGLYFYGAGLLLWSRPTSMEQARFYGPGPFLWISPILLRRVCVLLKLRCCVPCGPPYPPEYRRINKSDIKGTRLTLESRSMLNSDLMYASFQTQCFSQQSSRVGTQSLGS